MEHPRPTIPPERRVRTMLYRVFYKGYYLIEADSEAEAIVTARDDIEVEYEEWENERAELFE